MDSSELMVMRMGRRSLASKVATDQPDSSSVSLKAKLTSGEVDGPFVGSRIASFSLRMV